jgi:hypothetical protein
MVLPFAEAAFMDNITKTGYGVVLLGKIGGGIFFLNILKC